MGSNIKVEKVLKGRLSEKVPKGVVNFKIRIPSIAGKSRKSKV